LKLTIQIPCLNEADHLETNLTNLPREIFRTYAMYWPVQTSSVIALGLLVFGLALGFRFLCFHFTGGGAGHVQSLLVGVAVVLMAFVVGLLGDLLAANRRLAEELVQRVRRLDAIVSRELVCEGSLEGIRSTGRAPWHPRSAPQRAAEDRASPPALTR